MDYYSLRLENSLLARNKMGFDLLSIYLNLVKEKQIPLKPLQYIEAIKKLPAVVFVCMYPQLFFIV